MTNFLYLIRAAALALCSLTLPALAQSPSPHDWPGLTDPQKAALTQRLAAFKDAKIEVLCDRSTCSDLAEDIDDACEDAGIASVLDHSMMPVGYAFFVQAEPGDPNADPLAAAVADAVGVNVDVVRGHTEASGYPLWIVIGKKPRT